MVREYYVESHTDFTGFESFTQNEDKMTWTKYQSKMIQNAIISHCHICD